MAEVIIMPKLGFNMDEGELVRWHKQTGDSVKRVRCCLRLIRTRPPCQWKPLLTARF